MNQNERWYYARNKDTIGPLTLADIRAKIQRGEIKSTDLVYHELLGQWTPAGKAALLQDAFNAPPVAPPIVISSKSNQSHNNSVNSQSEYSETINNPAKIAIVGMTGSGKTVLVTTLSVRTAQMSIEDVYMGPYGPNRHRTLQYSQSNWDALLNGQWPPSTPAGELIELQWELTTKNCQAIVQFLDCAGQDISSLFRTEYFDPSNLGEDLRRVYNSVNSANVLILLINMKDLQATSNRAKEVVDLDQMIHILQQRNDIPRRIAVAFSQYDQYKPEVDEKFNGDFLEYVRYYLPYLFGQYKRFHKFEMIPVAAVNDTRTVVENGEVKKYPAPGFSSYNLDKLILWIANSVEELTKEIAETKKKVSNHAKPENAIKSEVGTKDAKKFTVKNLFYALEAIVFFLIAFALFEHAFYGFLFFVWGLVCFYQAIDLNNAHNTGGRKTYFINGVEFAFRWCPAGKFTRRILPKGINPIQPDCLDRQEITLTKGFWMMETMVTQRQWRAIMGNNPSQTQGDNLPVENVSWFDCQEFCKKCSQLGLPLQLPTIAQWEYACRANATESPLDNFSSDWYLSLHCKIYPVGDQQPNAWGLYDMLGNAWEWCADCECDYPGGSLTDPTGPSSGKSRSVRGGGCIFGPNRAVSRMEHRFEGDPETRGECIGFRCILYNYN